MNIELLGILWNKVPGFLIGFDTIAEHELKKASHGSMVRNQRTIMPLLIVLFE